MTTLRFLCLPANLLLALLVVTSGLVAAEDSERAKPAWRLVNFWSEWCAPCRDEIPMLNALSDELAAHAIEVVGVNFDDDPRTETLEVAAALGIGFPTLTRAEVAHLRVRSPSVMPTTYILAPGNVIAGSLIGLQTRESILARLTQLGALPAP